MPRISRAEGFRDRTEKTPRKGSVSISFWKGIGIALFDGLHNRLRGDSERIAAYVIDALSTRDGSPVRYREGIAFAEKVLNFLAI